MKLENEELKMEFEVKAETLEQTELATVLVQAFYHILSGHLRLSPQNSINLMNITNAHLDMTLKETRRYIGSLPVVEDVFLN